IGREGDCRKAAPVHLEAPDQFSNEMLRVSGAAAVAEREHFSTRRERMADGLGCGQHSIRPALDELPMCCRTVLENFAHQPGVVRRCQQWGLIKTRGAVGGAVLFFSLGSAPYASSFWS